MSKNLEEDQTIIDKENDEQEVIRQKDDGAVLFYSLKNPSLPENIIRTESSVTTIDFSNKKP